MKILENKKKDSKNIKSSERKSEEKEIKQVIIVRKDLNMSKGKIAAQCCHACLNAYEKSDAAIRKIWKKQGEKKIILAINNLEELLRMKSEAERLKIPSFLVIDAGKTELNEGTITCLALGPDYSEKIDKITGRLKTL